MTYAQPHYLLSFGGPLRSSGEQWSMGLRVLGSVLTPAAELTQLEALRTALASAWTAQAISSSAAQLEWCKYNQIGLDGRYVRAVTNRYDWATPVNGGGAATNVYPNQISLAVSLTTAFNRGLANMGRIYFPLPSGAIDPGTGVMNPPAQELMRGHASGFIDALNAVITHGAIGVASKVRTGAQHTVTGVSVGRVLDTMRSRRTSLTEDRIDVALTNTGGFSGGGGPF